MYVYMYMYICIYVYICIYNRDLAAFILSATCEKKGMQETYIRFITKTNKTRSPTPAPLLVHVRYEITNKDTNM